MTAPLSTAGSILVFTGTLLFWGERVLAENCEPVAAECQMLEDQQRASVEAKHDAYIGAYSVLVRQCHEKLKRCRNPDVNSATGAAGTGSGHTACPPNENPATSARCLSADDPDIPAGWRVYDQNNRVVGKVEDAGGTERRNTVASPSCKSAHKRMQFSCAGQEYSGVIQNTIAAFQAASGSGNMKEQCSNAKKLASFGLAVNAGSMVACQFAMRKCESTCKATASTNREDGALAEECSASMISLLQGSSQILANAAVFAQSKNCERMAEGMTCMGPEAFNDERCPQQFCTNYKNKDNPVCVELAGGCNSSRGKDNPVCFCLANPTDPKCGMARTLTPPPAGNTAVAAPGAIGNGGYGTPTFNVGDENLGDQQFLGSEGKQPNRAQIEYSDAKGGGLNPLGGGGAGFASQGGGKGNGTGPYNTDILKGTGGAAGGAGGALSFGGGYGGGYPSGVGNRGSNSDKGSGIDLAKYLPKIGQKRMPANVNAQLFNAGITAANGLSNFEKITRKMNEKRSHLLP